MVETPPGSGKSGAIGLPNDQLDSWKEIAVYLQREVRTVRRWEKKEGLPVHRHLHQRRSTVYAYRSEIDAWLAKRRPDLEEDKPADRFSSLRESSRLARWLGLAVALLLVAGLFWWLGADLFSPSTVALNFKERDWILITSFDNRTGESVLDRVLEYVLERELSNSQFVNVVPRLRINDTLRLMRRPLDSPVDAALGREIALRDGAIPALLTGQAEKLGSVYVFSVKVVDPLQGLTVASASEEAVSEDEIWPAVRRLSSWVREILGEALLLIRQSNESFERVTTPSLKALRLYSQAMALSYQISHGVFDQQWPVIEQLLKQAVREEPEFASAHLLLARALRGQRKPVEEYLPHAELALQLSDRTTERERYFILGSYYEMAGQPEKAISSYQALLRLYPDHYWATTNLAGQYAKLGRVKEAIPYWVRSADLRPHDFTANQKAAARLAVWGQELSQARAYNRRALELVSPEQDPARVIEAKLFSARENWLAGKLEATLREVESLTQTLKSQTGERKTVFASSLANFYLVLGKLQLADQLLGTHEVLDAEVLVTVALLRNDRRRMEYLLGKDRQLRQGTLFGPVETIILARVGLRSEAEKAIERLRVSSPARTVWLAELAMARGELGKTIRLLQEVIDEGRPRPVRPLVLLATESLAKAWERQGNFSKAIQVLEESSQEQQKIQAIFSSALSAHAPIWGSGLSPLLWMRCRLQLAELYGKVGQEEKARAIAAELLKLLAYADSDHPLLLQLSATRKTSHSRKIAEKSG